MPDPNLVNEIQSIGMVVIGAGALLGLFTAATLVFVTRWEHNDVTGRLGRLERWQDKMRGEGGDPNDEG